MREARTTQVVTPQDWLRPMDLAGLFDQPARPVEVDVGSGKGRFLLARAAAHPDIHFLGIDRMLQRIRRVDRKALRLGLANLRLLRVDAYYAVTYLLPPASVDVFYVFFPDPWPKGRHRHHRLFHPRFNAALLRVLRPGGRLHVATDHLPYFEEIEKILRLDPGWTPLPPWRPAPEEKTDFELLYEATKPIGRASFCRRDNFP